MILIGSIGQSTMLIRPAWTLQRSGCLMVEAVTLWRDLGVPGPAHSVLRPGGCYEAGE
jgi:hypothetical protein